MNENIVENTVSVESGILDDGGIVSSVSSGYADGEFTTPVTDISVSGGDFINAATLGNTETIALTAEDVIPHLEKIEYNQTALIFILLFIWCERKVKNAVRGFTGRGLDE